MQSKSKLLLSLILTLFSFSVFSKVYVISDIDDTIKKANSEGSTIPLAYHFLRKKIYPEMRDLYNELQAVYEKLGEEVEFIYVSAAPDFTFNQDKWIQKHNFPAGRAILRKAGSGDTYNYKTKTISEVLSSASTSDIVYFFGDNSSKDPIVYKEVSEKLGLDNNFIFIRDVSTEATFWESGLPVNQLNGVNYFFSERELVGLDGLFFMSNDLVSKIQNSYDQRELIPCYTEKTLKKRLKAEWGCGYDLGCRRLASKKAEEFWSEYYRRF